MREPRGQAKRAVAWTVTAWGVLGGLALPVAPQDERPAAPTRPSPSPSPAPRLRLDIEKHTQRVLDEKGLPRFETRVEVEAQSPQALLNRYFEGSPCAPAGGVPTETQAGRPSTSPSADFLGVAKALGKLLQSRGPERFFIYRIQNSERIRYSLREGRVPADWLSGVNGTLYELIAAYSDRDDAARALRRLERGADTKETEASPCPPSK